jgi:hypothetical protein
MTLVGCNKERAVVREIINTKIFSPFFISFEVNGSRTRLPSREFGGHIGTECTLVHYNLYTRCIYRVLTPHKLKNQVVNLHYICNKTLSYGIT